MLWSRRKKHPTLKSFRHQIGFILKASGQSPEAMAYVMGHQSTESISVYGDGCSGADRQSYLNPVEGIDLSEVRKSKSLDSPGFPRHSMTVSGRFQRVAIGGFGPTPISSTGQVG